MNGNTLSQINGGGSSVTVVPKVTASAYTAGNVIGGIVAFPAALPATLNGILNTITVQFGSVQTAEIDVAVFIGQPSGTYADKGAPSIVAADIPLLVGIFALTANKSSLGTHTVYNLNGIGQQVNGLSMSLFAVPIAVAALTPASISDLQVTLGVVW
jgi:cellobiose-specific phosphotransferase system component IIC